MEWLTCIAAWDAKCHWIESSHRLAEEGRLCSELRCTARSVMAFAVERKGRKWEAGFCGAHGLAFAALEPTDYTVGPPRRLEDDEALAGPLVQGKDQDEDDAPTRRRAPRRGLGPRRP